MKRLFIATPIIQLSPEIKQIISGLQFEMRHDDAVWVKDEVLHLTLRFLGATPDSHIPQVKRVLTEVCQNKSSFYLNINKIGVFGSKYQPKVLWLGFDNFEPFKEIFENIEPKLQEIGFEPNYGNFVPHLTLCRIKSINNKPKFWKTIEEISNQPISQNIKIDKLNLYQSFLHKEGPEYKVLGSANLK